MNPLLASDEPLEAHVVSHTHWDREWYLPAGRFRQRLVALIDELLDGGVEERAFLLDGQVVVLEDYLEVRPERRAEVAARLRDGRLEAGPWYVLADELIPSGESLVRNLLAGRRLLRALRAEPPPVLYSPDAFGHPAALPAVAAGFEFPLIILWRGYGGARWPAGDVVRWEAPDGSSALIYHLPRSGYEFGSALPSDARAAAERWTTMRAELGARSTLGIVLVPNGADHHARQAALADAMLALRTAAKGDAIVESSLSRFGEAIVAASAGMALPVVEGELRDSYGYTWTLQGTFGSRAHQKRVNAHVERTLLRESEPWSALAWHAGRPARRHLLDAAWASLLRCHPHDTLCGCSADEVARAMDVRLEDASTQAFGIRDDALLDIVGHDPVAARGSRGAWREVVIVRNPVARSRGGVAEVELRRFLTDVPVGPGSAHAAPPPRLRLSPPELDGGRIPLQILDRRTAFDRVESPQHYPDNDLVEVVNAVAWIPPVPGYGTTSYALDAPPEDQLVLPSAVGTRGTTLDNGIIAVGCDDAGNVHLASGSSSTRIASLIRFEDVPDVGDLYTHSSGGSVATHAVFLGAHVVHRGPLRGVIEARWRLRLPSSATMEHEHRRLSGYTTPASALPAFGSAQPVQLEILVRLSVDMGSEIVRIEVSGENVALDHRLRILFDLPVEGSALWADAAFGPIPRKPLTVSPEEAAIEALTPSAPLHRYVSVYGRDEGATIISDGLAEYEAVDGTVGITLVRAVGELSRNDLPERPGHAGWPIATPLAQCLGRFEGRFAVFLHGSRTPAAIAAIERAAEEALLPLTGTTLRSALALPPTTHGAELVGEGLALSCIKESEDGGALILRCVNLTEATVAGAWILATPVEGAYTSRLDETPLDRLTVRGREIPFTAEARAIVTIRVTRAGGPHAGPR